MLLRRGVANADQDFFSGFIPWTKKVPMTDNLAVVDTWDLGNRQLSRCLTTARQADAAPVPLVPGILALDPAQGLAHLMPEHCVPGKPRLLQSSLLLFLKLGASCLFPISTHSTTARRNSSLVRA